MNTLSKISVDKLIFPVDGYFYNVSISRSVDGGKTYLYCGCGRYCKTMDDVERFIAETKIKENVVADGITYNV